MTMSRRAIGLACAALATAGLAACSGGSKPSSTPTTAVPTTSMSTPVTSSSAPAQPAAVNPFTGEGPVPKSPTVIVKIDDTAAGRPQVGIDKADIVYVEAVEGGLTRLAAVFGSAKPTTVGYVRSTRPSDPDLFLQFGKITEAYSGGAHDSLPRVRRSGITSWSNDAGAAYYSRQSHPGDHGYINLVLNVRKVAEHVKTPRPKSIGWTFNPSLAGLSTTPAPKISTTVSGSYAPGAGTPVTFRWSARLKKYVRYINGTPQKAADGKPIAATNVIVQYCKVVSHPQDTDIAGNPSQFTYSVGSGKVLVFRQGRRIDGTWSRPKQSAGTTLRTSAGKPLPLNPGNTWVVLATRGTPTTS
ncbi:MAG TPA: DUF3048 C-terminal domain-containing protein [Jatrophihabitantaceae bacterium]|nr:DUF3048 C-terminal domain-containing protein [Jatrophihabitantaceae bacterium]